MAPIGDFPTFKSREDYRITEGLEPLFVVIIILVVIGVFGIIYCCTRCCCNCCKCGSCNSRNEKCKPPIGMWKILSYVFGAIEVAQDDGKTVVLISKTKMKNWCTYGACCVFGYYIIELILLGLLFLVLFCNFLLYRKTSTCNDINVKTEYSICFDINDHYKKVDCISKQEPDLQVICYLTDFAFFRALGTAFAAANAISAVISVFSSIGIKMVASQPHRCVFITIQVLFGTISCMGLIALYTWFYNYVLYGDPPLIHATVCIATVLFAILFWGFPWCAFSDSSTFQQELVTIDDKQCLCIIEESQPQEDQDGQGNQNDENNQGDQNDGNNQGNESSQRSGQEKRERQGGASSGLKAPLLPATESTKSNPV